MENFDDAVTDPRLQRQELEIWAHENIYPEEKFCNEFIVIRSSGTSGYQGTFVYDEATWRAGDLAIAGRLPAPENYPNKTRVAWQIDSHGRRAADVGVAVRMRKNLYENLILSLVEDTELLLDKLNVFQPHRLSGYSSCISMLADFALQGKLHIQPKTIIVSGDLLTDGMRRKIGKAWGAPIFEMYASSEALYIAVKDSTQDEMRVIEELNIIEVLEGNDRAARPGEQGRVVLTNLCNYVLPVLRYELGDYVELGRGRDDFPFTAASIRNIKGRVNDALPVVLKDGRQDSIHPLALPLYVIGLEKIQFISRQPDQVQIHYVAQTDIDTAVRNQFQQLLDIKGATRTSFDVRRVPQIANDPQTGKFRLIRIESQLQTSSGLAATSQKEDSRRIGPVNSFVEFRKEEIEQSIADRFEKVVQKYPYRMAIKTESHELSYEGLNRTANRLARAILQERGEGEEPIALLLEKNAPMIAAILGVLKAGKIYMPVDPSYPLARINAMMEDSGAGLIVTNNRNLVLAESIAQHDHQLINFDELDSSVAGENMGLAISPNNFASILYTSGSTGEPKGVVQNHRNILYKIRTYTNNLAFSADDRISLLSPCTFSLSVGFIFGALLNGGCLFPKDIKEEGFRGLANWLTKESITVFNAVPTAFRAFIDSLTTQEKFPALRLIHMGGAATRRDVELYKNHFSPACTMVHDLGSNESGTIAQYVINHTTQIHGNTVPAGYAVEGGEILVLDDDGIRLPHDHVGEIALKSRYVALGYWRKPDLTRAAFLPDPTGGEERIYRTGDLGIMRYDGRLQYVGRKDFQVKIRGHRVELAEIEMALLGLAEIKEAVVVSQEDVPDEKRLVAYVVSKPKTHPTTSELRKLLKGKLPEFMIPSVFMFLDALPLTPSGKVDRQALPQPDHTGLHLEETFVTPRNPMERQIADIWSEVLKVDRVGIDHDFFDLGGHSLLAAQVITRVRDIFNVDLPFGSLLAKPTVASMAAVIVQYQVNAAEQEELRAALEGLDELSEEETNRLLVEAIEKAKV
jgi:amino acid adenylation domain-containing protein